VGPFGSKKPDIRFRPLFRDWKTKVTVQFDAAVITPSQIAHLFNQGGFSIGLGEWRMEKSGTEFGYFEVGSSPAKMTTRKVRGRKG
jgi:hypothetical protein